MSKLVILITSRTEDVHAVGEAWQKAGAPGVTIIESYGLRRLQEKSKALEILPGMMSLQEIMRESDITSVFVLSVVHDEQVDALLAATEAVLGDLDQPDTGVAFVLDVERAIGIRHFGQHR
ncbi:MAG: hypothetical protein HXY41_02250 [Chloroflexi bacterium]|nr:hypothetical protein [Chloroflexota bacterium]